MFVPTFLLCTIHVSGTSTSSRPGEDVARATWSATLAGVAVGIVGIVTIIRSAARGRR